jgi:O-antigen/teichoic acid export membrane protein
MVRQIASYVPATLVPAAVSFLLIYLYTRLLTPAEYGYFSLAFAVVQFAQTTLFFAIPITLTRYYPEAVAEDRAESFLSDCYMLFYALAGATARSLPAHVGTHSGVDIHSVRYHSQPGREPHHLSRGTVQRH